MPHPYTTVAKVRANAAHLANLSDEAIGINIDDAYSMYVQALEDTSATDNVLETCERFLTQHISTLNVRRNDDQSIGDLSASLTVVRGMGLDQTEYGQAAKTILLRHGINPDQQRAVLGMW